MAQGITRCAQWSRLTLEDMKRSQSKHAICCVRERKAKRRKGREQDFVMFATFRKLHRTKCLWKRKEVVVFKNYKNGQPFLSWLSASCFSLSFSSVPFSFGGVKSCCCCGTWRKQSNTVEEGGFEPAGPCQLKPFLESPRPFTGPYASCPKMFCQSEAKAGAASGCPSNLTVTTAKYANFTTQEVLEYY